MALEHNVGLPSNLVPENDAAILGTRENKLIVRRAAHREHKVLVANVGDLAVGFGRGPLLSLEIFQGPQLDGAVK